MTQASPFTRFTITTALLLCGLGNALAQAPNADTSAAVDSPAASVPAPAYEPGTRGQVDIGMGFASLTGGNSHWNDQFIRGNIGLKPGTTLNWSWPANATLTSAVLWARCRSPIPCHRCGT